MRRLEREAVPVKDRHRFLFGSQHYRNKTPTERTLTIIAWCDNHTKCGKVLTQRVTDVRNRYKRGESLTLLCDECRVGRKFINADGYVVVYQPNHPNAQRGGSLYEHVVIMSEMIGRPLLPGENVHHKNGARSDNRPENLELWSVSQPAGQRLEDKIKWAVELHDAYPKLWEDVQQNMKAEADERN